MGWGIKLTDEQWDELDRVRFTAKSAEVFRNCLIILKSDSRDTIASIAEDLGCSTDTVIRVRRLYRKGGVNALKPLKPPGRPGRATPEFIEQMRQAVLTNPLSCRAVVAGATPPSDRDLLAAAVLPQPEPDRTTVGPFETNRAGQRAVQHVGRLGRRLSPRRRTHQRPPREDGLHVRP